MASNYGIVSTVNDNDDDSPPAYSEICKYSQQNQPLSAPSSPDQQLIGSLSYENSKRDSLPVYTSLDGSDLVHLNQYASSATASGVSPTITELNSYEYLTGRRILNGAGRGSGAVDTLLGPVEPPQDYLCWSIFNCLFCNICCFGFISLYYSLRSMSAYKQMNLSQAVKYSQKAKRLNQSLVEAGVSLFLLFIIKFFFLGR